MKFLFYTYLISFLLFSFAVHASHIRAGEITAVRISNISYSYQFTFIGYRDTQSDVKFGNGLISFGDGSENRKLDVLKKSHVIENLGNNIEKNTFIFEHNFPNAQEYIISYLEENRNANILTMYYSFGTPFYIETKIIIDPYFGLNNTPTLLVPPIDRAATGAIFIHNPGAYDIEGDSLSYRIVENKQAKDVSVNGFLFPNDPSLYVGLDYYKANQAGNDRPTFTLDPISGDLVWDAPGMAGEYNLAFIVEEWRKIGGIWYLLSETTRDMQVLVEKTDNNPPELILPKDTCIIAGSSLMEVILGNDPDGHDVKLESFSGVYQLHSSPATFSPNPPVYAPVIAKMDFIWQTNGTHVRSRAYQVQFKATDDPPLGPSLVDLQTWNILVVGPAPENLTAIGNLGRTVNLNWNAYKYKNHAQQMQIWRRVGSFDFEADNCQTGIPDYAGYQLISEVNINNASFVDNSDLKPGAVYCYRLVAQWPLPGGGESYASEEVCVKIDADIPLITNVSVENTHNLNGEILVKWTSPLDINPAFFPPPFRYDLLRSTGFNGKNNITLVTSIFGSEAGVEEALIFEFKDRELNTQTQIYNYRVVLYDANNVLIDTSAIASSVRLEAGSVKGGVDLTWKAEVPWNNNIQENPYHLIYRNDGEDGDLKLIDSVNVNHMGYKYLDLGQYNGAPLSDAKEYCYFIETRGSYGNPKILSPLLNKSQIICALPNDTIPPCAPTVKLDAENPQECFEFLNDKDCDFNNFYNTITWDDLSLIECGEDISSYNVYFSPNGEEALFQKVSPEGFTATSFKHYNQRSLAGCYRITAVDRSGNESGFNETICKDNCPQYELPNVFTPNEDGYNDTFRPKDCPRFVEAITFRVINRWGKEVYAYSTENPEVEKNFYIDWTGETNKGEELPSGLYYYVADVKFLRLKQSDSIKKFKGWVQLLR